MGACSLLKMLPLLFPGLGAAVPFLGHLQVIRAEALSGIDGLRVFAAGMLRGFLTLREECIHFLGLLSIVQCTTLVVMFELLTILHGGLSSLQGVDLCARKLP